MRTGPIGDTAELTPAPPGGIGHVMMTQRFSMLSRSQLRGLYDDVVQLEVHDDTGYESPTRANRTAYWASRRGPWHKALGGATRIPLCYTSPVHQD